MASEQEIRQRKRPKQQKSQPGSNVKSVSTNASGTPAGDTSETVKLFYYVWAFIGFVLMIYCGYWFANYVQTLHENQMWFTNIQEVEREISLRTECGLYYSYYKQLVHSPSLAQGIVDLTKDNSTEQGHTINILERFNIYQEVILAVFYRILKPFLSQPVVQPILFYIYSIFKLNGFYVSVLFGLTWTLTSGSWLAGFLSFVFYVVNLDDTTRVSMTINLRECFGFPIFWCQIFAICLFLRRSQNETSKNNTLLSGGIFLFTYLFSLTWQFNQFILLLQAGSIFLLGILHLTPQWKLRRILCLHAFALIAVCLTQFGQPMLLGSLLLSFVPAAVLSLYLFSGWKLSGYNLTFFGRTIRIGLIIGPLKLLIQSLFTFCVMLVVHYSVKNFLKLEADEHIFKFLKGKFGFEDPRDFESRIYLCHGAFKFLEDAFFYRTSSTLLFPLYSLMVVGSLIHLAKDILSQWCTTTVEPNKKHVSNECVDVSDRSYYFNRRPELAFLVVQSIVSGLLAIIALRMKYLWTPHMCVLAAVMVGDKEIIGNILTKIKLPKTQILSNILSTILCLALIAVLVNNYLPAYKQQMTDLKEFYDPDTVQLMNWINTNTKVDESFAGSMQLLAGVKCCTGRHLTNHPHFEDKFLRDRTRQVYQIYGRRQPSDVYKILKSFNTHYIILEDSICLARSDGCSTPDLVDLDNYHIPDNNKFQQLEGLKKSDVPRFCFEIRKNSPEFSKYFHLVLSNPTFRVYKLL